jgi:hypothetical protein
MSNLSRRGDDTGATSMKPIATLVPHALTAGHASARPACLLEPWNCAPSRRARWLN